MALLQEKRGGGVWYYLRTPGVIPKPACLATFNALDLILEYQMSLEISLHDLKTSLEKCSQDLYSLSTGEFTKRVQEMLSQLFVTLFTLSIYPSEHKQLRQPNPFHEFPCIIYNELF